MKRLLLAAMSLALCQASTRAADQHIPASIQQPLPLADFAGFYAAGGGGYGVSVQRNVEMRESVSGIPTFFCCTPISISGGASGQVAAQGWFGAAVTGYNVQYGAFLGGVELSGRWGREGADFASRSTLVSVGNAATIDRLYEFRSDTGANLAGRLGVVFGRTLVFTKIGVGVAHAEDRFSFRGSGQVCVTARFVGTQVVCEATLPVGSAAFTLARWSPSIVAGVGIEHNIGRFFVRVGAELEGITGLKGTSILSVPVPLFPSGSASGAAFSEPFWTTRGAALVGFRF